ncbi:MAG: SPOR domain-containing protein, partial [Bacteroidota bacterium]
MKNLLFLALLFPLSIFAQKGTTYTIQLGTFVNPQKSEFQLLEQFGYLTAEPFKDNFYQVFLGEYPSEYNALTVLKLAEDKGYSGFVVPKNLEDGKELIVVQFDTEKRGVPINWNNYKAVENLHFSINDTERVKFYSGPFKNRPKAMRMVVNLQKLGYQDAFVRTINSQLLHKVGAFEKGINLVQNDLNSAVETILADKTPTTYEATTPVITTSQNVRVKTVATEAITPNIRPLIKRTAALDIQKVLKAYGYFQGSLDGFYGKATAAGYENFTSTDLQYEKYQLLSSFYEKFEAEANLDLQSVINNLPDSPIKSIEKLKAIQNPL